MTTLLCGDQMNIVSMWQGSAPVAAGINWHRNNGIPKILKFSVVAQCLEVLRSKNEEESCGIAGESLIMRSTCLLLLLLSLSLSLTTASNARRGPFQQEEAIDVDPAAMQGDPNDLTDEQLHLNHGSLTPTKLTAMKAEMQVLQQSLGNLMEKQTALQTKYEIESERAVEDKALKKKVKMEVARSLLKNLDQQSQSRTGMYI